MNIETNDKVTLSLEKYEEMKAELSQLRKLVQEKEIVRYYPHPVFTYVILLLLLSIPFILATFSYF